MLRSGFEMSFLRAACVARAGQSGLPRILGTVVVVIVVVSAGLSLSCGNSSFKATAPDQNAYVTLPALGSVLLLHITAATGAITQAAQTPTTQHTSPTG